jgi:hypothetical protein
MIQFTNKTYLNIVKWELPFWMFVSTLRTENGQFRFCFCLFLFICRVSICEEKELIISVLKSSNRFPISALVSPPLAYLCTLEKVVSLVVVLFLVDPREHLLQRFTMSS